MKILFFNTNIGYGGASKMMAEVANNLSRSHEVVLLTFRDDRILQPLAPGVKHVHDTLCVGKIKVLRNLGQICALRKYLKQEKFDLAIAFLHPSHYMLTLAAKGTKTKVLLSERGDPYSRATNGGVFVHVVEKVIQGADAYVFQSNGAKDAYPPKCREKGRVIVNALPEKDLPRHCPETAEKVIVHVARMELIQKRQDIMLRAFARFLESHPGYVLRFLGDGPEEETMKQLAQELGIAESVEFLGACKNVPQLIAQAQMFVLTSDYEGIPNALLEAMAVGLPCISTDCSPGGARMVIEDDQNGFIVPCGEIEPLADRMCRLADDADIRRRFSEKALASLGKFDQKVVNAQWEEFIGQIGETK